MGMFDAPESRGPREVPPEGKHTGILYMIVDCGSHHDSYQGVAKIKHQIYVAWELVGTEMSDGRPFVIGNYYNVTDGNYGWYLPKTSNANKMLRSWTGGDEKACSKVGLLGKLLHDQTPCFITISHEEKEKMGEVKVYATMESIKPWKGAKKPERANEPVVYGPVGSVVPDSVPGFLKRKIEACLELNGGVPKRDEEPKPATKDTGETYEDIPF